LFDTVNAQERRRHVIHTGRQTHQP
jgi:hypothetical protein